MQHRHPSNLPTAHPVLGICLNPCLLYDDSVPYLTTVVYHYVHHWYKQSFYLLWIQVLLELGYDDENDKYMMDNNQTLTHKKFFHKYFRHHNMLGHTMSHCIGYK